MPRPVGKEFQTLNFTLLSWKPPDDICGRKKYEAQCNICGKRLKNTSAERLMCHRMICPGEDNSKSSDLKSKSAKKTRLAKKRKHNVRVLYSSNIRENVDNIDVVSAGEANNGAEGSDDVSTNNEPEMFLEVEEVENVEMNVALANRTDFPICDNFEPKPNVSSHLHVDCRSILLSPDTTDCKWSKSTGNECSNWSSSADSFVDSVTEEEKKKITEALYNFFSGCNIPFKVVDSKHFRKLITTLRPAYAPYLPNSKKLGSTSLEETFRRCVKKDKKKYAISAYFLDPNHHTDLLKTIKNITTPPEEVPQEKRNQYLEDKSQYLMFQNFLLESLSGEDIKGFYNFQKKEDIFSLLFKRGVKNPEAFWSMVEPHYPELAKFALLSLKCRHPQQNFASSTMKNITKFK